MTPDSQSPRRGATRHRSPPAFLRPLCVAALLLGSAPDAASGQRVLDPLGDATLPRPGQVRVGLGGRWDWFDALRPAAGGRDLVPLGDGVLGTPTGDRLAGFVTAPLRRLTGDTALAVTAGSVAGVIEARNWAIPISLEIGVTSWLAVQATVPIRQPFTAVFVRPNPPGTVATLGRNPALETGTAGDAARLAATNVATQLVQVQSALRTARPECFTATPAGTCAPVIAAATRAGEMSLDIQRVYLTGRPFVPLAGSRTDTLLAQQFAALNATVRSLTGATADPVTARPVQAAARMGFADFQRMVLDAGFDSLGSRRRILMGDASAGVVVRLFDGIGATDRARQTADALRLRSSLRVLAQFGTGQVPIANQWADQGSGTDGRALDLRWTTDVLLNRHAWITVAAGQRQWQSELMPPGTIMVTERTTPFGVPEPTIGGMPVVIDPTARWRRTRGTERTLDVVPRLLLSKYLAVQGAYRWRRREADRFGSDGAVFAPAGEALRPAGIDGLLSLGGSEHRAGIGLTFSTLAATRRAGGVPVEVSYLHQQVIGGTNLPRMTSDAVQLRWYWPASR